MKKIWLLIATILIIFSFFSFTAEASTASSGTCGDNLIWNLSDRGVLTISGTGEMNKTILLRGGAWLKYKDSIKSVKISEGVTSIADYAFDGCRNLISIEIPKGITKIGSVAFRSCESLRSIELPKGLTSIGNSAFEDCSSLESIELSVDLTLIEDSTFKWCSSLKSVEIPQGLTEIENSAFWGCSKLESIKLPEGLSAIWDNAFWGCSSLKSIEIPRSVTKINDNVFWGCGKLESIKLPEGLTVIGNDAIRECSSLESIELPESLTEIGEGAFLGCKSLKSIEIPEGVTVIPAFTFRGCSSLKSIELPEGLTIIGGCAFEACSSLKSFTFLKGITEIAGYAFSGCTELESVFIPSTIEKIGKRAFENCTSLVSFVFTDNIDYRQLREYYEFFSENESFNERVVIYGYNQNLSAQWLAKNYNVPFGILDESVSVLFKDIPINAWYTPTVQYVYDNGIMAGMGEVFQPNGKLTREQFVQVLYNNSGKPVVSIENKFPDVKDAWYKNAVLWANANDIANGKGNGDFGVTESISRQDLALMLYKYARMNGYDLTANTGEINKYADGSKVSSYAKTAMDWAITKGVMSGKGTKGEDISTFKLDPTGTATRAECAAMLKNFMEAYGDK